MYIYVIICGVFERLHNKLLASCIYNLSIKKYCQQSYLRLVFHCTCVIICKTIHMLKYACLECCHICPWIRARYVRVR